MNIHPRNTESRRQRSADNDPRRAYSEIFPIGSTISIDGYPLLTVGGYVDELPGVDLFKDGKRFVSINPEWLIKMGATVRRVAQ